jgi:hypothetical protein
MWSPTPKGFYVSMAITTVWMTLGIIYVFFIK